MPNGTMYLNASNSQANLNRMIDLANGQTNLTNPEIFYSKQVLDTIQMDADNYVYYRYADETPIQEKADKLTLHRWAPLQAHTTPLQEGVPPISDKGSVEKYELTAKQYGRYMEFTDKVNFAVVDPVVAHYTRQYAIVAIETLDMLARETLLATAQKQYAKAAKDFEALTVASIPNLTDLRMIVLQMKKALVKPRTNGRFHVIGSPEFYFDMISDPTVEQYMKINQTTATMYSDTKLVPLFDMEFYETMAVPTSGEFMKNGVLNLRVFRKNGATYQYDSVPSTNTTVYKKETGYVKDARTKQDASWIPDHVTWDVSKYTGGSNNDWREFKAQHILVLGKDALIRTGLAGEGNTKVYTKPLGSTGVLDPIDQRQSIGFKINSVGFGTVRLEAVVDYICVPTQVNVL